MSEKEYIGTDDQIDDAFIEELLNLYHSETNKKNRINIRNTITDQLNPILKGTAEKWGDWEYKDLYQSLWIETCKLIDKWIPNRGSVGGYFRKALNNFCNNFNKREVYFRNKILFLNSELLESNSDMYHGNIFRYGIKNEQNHNYITKLILDRGKGNFVNDNLNAAYNHAIEWIKDCPGHYDELRAEIRQEYKLSHKEARCIIYHALITVRETVCGRCITGNMVGTTRDSLFKRFCVYLEWATVKEIQQVFGGIPIMITSLTSEEVDSNE